MADQTPDQWAGVPVAIRREAHECATSNGRIRPEYLAGLYQRGAKARTVIDHDGEVLTQAAVDRLLIERVEHQQTIEQQAEQIETLTQALARIEAPLRQHVYPKENSPDPDDPPYVCLNENGDAWLMADTLPEAVEELVGGLAQCEDRIQQLRASRPTEGEQGRLGNYYGRRLTASIEDGQVLVAIGVQTLAHAVAYADWANPFDEASDDYIRTFAIADAGQFAKDVVSAMLAEREDGSTPLSDFLDKMSQAAIEDGSLGLHEDEHRIKHGETAPCETWAEPEQGAPQ